jgi:hypothetical protein
MLIFASSILTALPALPALAMAAIDISGTVYSDKGTTPLGGVTVALSINGGAAAASAVSDGSTGFYTLSGVSVAAGDVLTLYIDNNGSHKAVTVTVGTGASLPGVNIYKNCLITREDNLGQMTNAKLATATANADADIAAIYTMTGSAMTVQNGKELFIPSSMTYMPGGNVTTPAMDVRGTLSHSSETITLNGNLTLTTGVIAGGSGGIVINGNYTQSGSIFTAPASLTISGGFTRSGGTFNEGTGTVSFIGSTSTINVVACQSFHNVIVNKTYSFYGLEITSGQVLVVNGLLTLTQGFLNTGRVQVFGNVVQGVNAGGGTAIVDFANDIANQLYTINGGMGPVLCYDSPADANDQVFFAANGSLYGLTITAGFGANTVPMQYNGFDLTIGGGGYNQAAGTFTAPNNLYTTLFTKTGGTFEEGTGTVIFQGSNGVFNAAPSEMFSNVTFSSHWAYCFTITAGQTMIVNGTLTLNTGCLNSGTIDVKGNIIQGASFSGGTTIVDFGDNGTVQTYTINGGTGLVLRLDDPADANDRVYFAANGTLYGLTITAGFGANTVPMQYNGFDLTIGSGGYNQAAGTFIAPNNLYTTFFTKTGGTFEEGTGTVIFQGGNGSFNAAPSEMFYNVTFSSHWAYCFTVTAGQTMIVSTTLTLNTGCLSSGTITVKGNIIQGASFSGGTTIVDFGDNGAIQTYTINGGTGPVLRFDDPADANDRVVFIASGALYGLTIASGFGANAVPMVYNGYDLTITDGGFVQATGTFTAPGVLTTRYFTKTGGVFDEGTGTVVFQSNSGSFNAPPSETFYNVTFNTHWAYCFTVTAGQTMIVAGNLTLNTGCLNAGIINVRGNIVQSANFNGGTTVIDFGDNSVAQTYTINGGIGPVVRFDDPADAMDAVVYNSDATLFGMTITSGFGANTVPIVYNGHTPTISDVGYSQAAGTFVAPPLLKLRYFNKTGGTFEEGTSTMYFYERWGAFNASPSESFYNVTFDGHWAYAFTVASGSTMICTGLLTFKVGSVSGPGTLEPWGDVVLQTGATSISVPLRFGGPNTQHFDVTGMTDKYDGNIIVNKTGGEVILSSPLLMDASGQQLIMQSGKLTPSPVNTITLGCNANGVGGYSSGYVDGPIYKQVCAKGSSNFTLPVGKDGAGRAVRLDVVHDSNLVTTYKMEMQSGPPPIRTIPPTLKKVSKMRYHHIEKGAGANLTSATVKIWYDGDDNANNKTYLRIAKDDGAGNWVDLGGAGTADWTGTITSTMSFNTFSDFVLASDINGDVLLPVELVSFSAMDRGSHIALRWRTATEVNNAGFDIERQGRDSVWRVIGNVTGAGSSGTSINYQFDDRSIAPNWSAYRYRLKQKDRDGKEAYSSIVDVARSSSEGSFTMTVLPNQDAESVSVRFALRESSRVSLLLFDAVGRLRVQSIESVDLESGAHLFTIDTSSLPSGVFFIVGRAGEMTHVVRYPVMR